MGKFSSQEIESQYNLIKKLLAEPEKYKDAINAIKKDIDYMPIELKKKLQGENIYFWIKSSLQIQFLEIYKLLKPWTNQENLNLFYGELN